MSLLQTLGSTIAAFFQKPEEPLRVPRTRKTEIVTVTQLEAWAAHQSGMKQAVARELLAARHVVDWSRSLTAAMESKENSPDAIADMQVAQSALADAIYQYDRTFTRS